MSTIYYDIECDFTQIPNHIILNPKVSGTAKAIYFYIVMRLRQNVKWEFYDFDIMEHLKEGRDSFRNAKKELLEYGYLVKVKQNIGNDGKYKGCDYAIKKEPITENPTSAKPKTDEPTSGNPYTNNNKQSNNINKKQSNQDKDTASGFSESDFLENFIQKHLSKMSESEKAGFQTFAVTQLEQVSEKLGRLLTQQECLEHCKKILNVMYPQNENPTVKDSLTVQKPKQEVQIEIIPNCIDISKWEEWKNYKKEKKQKLTKSTAEKQLQNLQKWHLEGQDPNEIIDKSISNGWQGLFPLKQEKSNQSTFNNQNRKPKLSMSESADLIRQMAQYTKEQQEKLNPEEYADPF